MLCLIKGAHLHDLRRYRTICDAASGDVLLASAQCPASDGAVRTGYWTSSGLQGAVAQDSRSVRG